MRRSAGVPDFMYCLSFWPRSSKFASLTFHLLSEPLHHISNRGGHWLLRFKLLFFNSSSIYIRVCFFTTSHLQTFNAGMGARLSATQSHLTSCASFKEKPRMIIEAARLAIANLLAPQTRTVFWKVLGITLLVLVALWSALHGALVSFALPWLEAFFPNIPSWAAWLAYGFAVMASFGLAIGLSLLLSPVTALIAGLFLDDIAEVVEKRDYPTDMPGRAMPFGPAIVSSLKFL